jgi:hypothetical protein
MIIGIGRGGFVVLPLVVVIDVVIVELPPIERAAAVREDCLVTAAVVEAEFDETAIKIKFIYINT